MYTPCQLPLCILLVLTQVSRLTQTYRVYSSFSDICGVWFGFGSGFGIGFTGTLLLTHCPLLLSTLLSHTIPFPHSRSLVCGGQTSPHKSRLVVSHSTCSPQSSSPHTHSFVLGTAVINNEIFNRYSSNKHTPTTCDGQPSPHSPLLIVSRTTCPPLSPSPHANSFIKQGIRTGG